MELVFKGMLYCKILLSKEAFNRNTKDNIKINVEIPIWIIGDTDMNTSMD